jgi:hypothetical protein
MEEGDANARKGGKQQRMSQDGQRTRRKLKSQKKQGSEAGKNRVKGRHAGPARVPLAQASGGPKLPPLEIIG